MAKICKNCKQGHTKEGYAAYPDHIELCPLHAAAEDLLEACKFALSDPEYDKEMKLAYLEAAIRKSKGDQK